MFKDFAFINTIEDDSLALALFSVPYGSAHGNVLFAAFPAALDDEMVAIPKSLLDRLNTFGYWRLVRALRDQGYQALRLVHRSPQDDFQGGGNAPPPGVGLAELRSGSFVWEDKTWIVFFIKEDQPYPVSRAERVDRTFVCFPESLLADTVPAS